MVAHGGGEEEGQEGEGPEEEEGQEGEGPEEEKEEEEEEGEEEEEEEKEGEEEEEEEEKEEEEGRALPGRQAPEGPAQEQGGGGGGQEEGCCDEEGRQGHLQAGHALLRPGEGHRHLGQGDPRRRDQGRVGLHQEEGLEQGPDGRQDRGHLRWRLDVQARRRREQAPEVSGCVFFLVNSARGSAGC